MLNIYTTLKKYNINLTTKQVVKMWNSEGRHYHTTENHLNHLLFDIHQMKDDLSVLSYDYLILAAIFHDIIYDPKRSDNELKSIEFFKEVCPVKMDKVENLIYDTITHNPRTELSKIFSDLDMKIVYSDYKGLLEWEKLIRLEYNFVEKSLYKDKRVQFLQSIIDNRNEENILRLIEFVKTN